MGKLKNFATRLESIRDALVKIGLQVKSESVSVCDQTIMLTNDEYIIVVGLEFSGASAVIYKNATPPTIVYRIPITRDDFIAAVIMDNLKKFVRLAKSNDKLNALRKRIH